MTRQITQSEKTDGYKLEVLCTKPIDLLVDEDVSEYIRPILFASVRNNLRLFEEKTGVIPTCASVSGNVKTKLSRFLNDMDNKEAYGENKSVRGQYEDDPYITLVVEGETHFVHISSTCKVEDNSSITINAISDIIDA